MQYQMGNCLYTVLVMVTRALSSIDQLRIVFVACSTTSLRKLDFQSLLIM
uniref:Uncharacterized protein n=1 Tax=Arundo donax TaxID=35708 RepID=A0A0A8Y6F5_ARUDO